MGAMKVLYRRKMRGVSYPITTILTIVILLAVGTALGLYIWKFKGPRAVIEPMGTPTYIIASQTLKIPLKNNGDASVSVTSVTVEYGGEAYTTTTVTNGNINPGTPVVVEVSGSSLTDGGGNFTGSGISAGASFDVIIEFDNGAVLTLKGYAV